MRVHIHSENLLKIQDYKAAGWEEVKRFGDVVEMEFTKQAQVKQKALGWLNEKMLTLKSGLTKEIKWPTR